MEHLVENSQQGYHLVHCDRDLLTLLWPKLILPGLKRIKQKDKKSGQWIPEHVRQRIEAGFTQRIFCECHLIVPDGEQLPVGFVVITMFPDEFVGVPLSLFVWIVYMDSKKANVTRALPGVQAGLEKRARELGLRYVDGISSRHGWMAHLGKQGYRIHQLILRKEIDP